MNATNFWDISPDNETIEEKSQFKPKISMYPNCCTIYVLSGFPETLVSGEVCLETYDKADIRKGVEDGIKGLHRKAMVSVSTNSQQKTTNKVLKELGFESTPWISKPQHSETKVKLWWLSISSYLESQS